MALIGMIAWKVLREHQRNSLLTREDNSSEQRPCIIRTFARWIRLLLSFCSNSVSLVVTLETLIVHKSVICTASRSIRNE